jgi:hypothetical protein
MALINERHAVKEKGIEKGDILINKAIHIKLDKLIVKDCQKFRTLFPCTVASPHRIVYISIISSWAYIIQ